MIVLLRREWPSVALVCAAWGMSAAAWPLLPDAVPVHWNLAGEVDRHGSRAEAALAMPLILTGLAAVLAAAPTFDPNGNIRSFAGAYDRIRYGVLGLELFVQAVVLGSALGLPLDGARLVVGAVGLLFAWLGNWMGKLRPNGFAGIRTPWTLSSLRSWNGTHRVGGWAFVGTGLATALAAVAAGVPVAIGALLLGSLGTVVGTTWLSYRLWREDPDKVPLGGVRPAE